MAMLSIDKNGIHSEVVSCSKIQILSVSKYVFRDRNGNTLIKTNGVMVYHIKFIIGKTDTLPITIIYKLLTRK